MVKVTGKRVCAYILDIMVVYFVVSLFAKIEFLNPHIEENKIIVEKYNEIYEDYLEAYKNNSSELEILNNELIEYQYDISKTSISNTIINILFTIIYFIIFQYFNKGQTIGKRLMKIKLVDNESNNRPSLIQVASRSLIVNSIITAVLTLLLTTYGTKEMYVNYGFYITLLDGILLLGTLGFMMFRQDGKGFHDLFANTSVISTEKVPNNLEESNVKELKSKDKESNIKEAKFTEKKSKSKKKGE